MKYLRLKLKEIRDVYDLWYLLEVMIIMDIMTIDLLLIMERKIFVFYHLLYLYTVSFYVQD